jgi:hypothetical protein
MNFVPHIAPKDFEIPSKFIRINVWWLQYFWMQPL